MTNIFENAKFGDKFKTREGWYAIYDGKEYYGTCGNVRIVNVLRYRGKDNKYCITVLRCKNNGKLVDEERKHHYDIVSEWKEKINEDELDSLAENAEMERVRIAKQCASLGQCYGFGYKEGFKDGYKKAKEG